MFNISQKSNRKKNSEELFSFNLLLYPKNVFIDDWYFFIYFIVRNSFLLKKMVSYLIKNKDDNV